MKKDLKKWNKPSIKTTLQLKKTLSASNKGTADGGSAPNKKS